MSFFKQLVAETKDDQIGLFNRSIIQRTLNGDITGDRYLRFLTQAYHHVKHTVPLLMACGSRLTENSAFVQKAIAEYIEEEVGHEQWILNDIRVCGGDTNAVAVSTPNFETDVMVAYAYHQIDRKNPMAFFGMVHVLEGTSTILATKVAELIKTGLGLPQNAFSYLISHGDLDQDHVKFFENLMNQITNEEDQQAIIKATKTFYRLYGDVLSSVE
jgi:pyrroloquinoline quinone (PQQ) biosynthesis protein C